MILSFFVNNIRRLFTIRKWRKRNKNNFTILDDPSNIDRVVVGKKTYGKITIRSCTDGSCKLIIGSYCSIAAGVLFMLGSEHRVNCISTYPFKVKLMREKREAFSKGDIVIGDDVWIGTDAKIMSGVHVGQGAIIGAGAIVTKDVPAYSIVGGIPAKVIKYRFDQPIIEKLVTIDFSALDDDFIKNHVELFYNPSFSSEDIDLLPKK